jgi:hypothetical protein
MSDPIRQLTHLLRVEPILGPLNPDRHRQRAVLGQLLRRDLTERRQNAFGQRTGLSEPGNLIALELRRQNLTHTYDSLRTNERQQTSERQQSLALFRRLILANRRPKDGNKEPRDRRPKAQPSPEINSLVAE